MAVMKILVAPDKFKDALDAPGVAETIARGACKAYPDVRVELCPLGDGGEGTGRLLAKALGAAEHQADVLDPLARLRAASWWRHIGGESSAATGIVELAEASGLWLLAPEQRRATETTSYGTGQLLAAAADSGCLKVVLCVGGSATVDGGAGCLQGLGWRLLDSHGREITTPMTGGGLTQIARIEPPTHRRTMDIEVLCDVTNPLLGPDGAAAVFGPQKGATPPDVRALEVALRHWADVLAEFARRDMAELPGTGAAGGLPFGLAATLEARLVSGFETMAESVELPEKISAADLVFTGEGRLDAQTTGGKVVGGVARLCRAAGKPCVALVGATTARDADETKEISAALGLRDIVVITPVGAALTEALARTGTNLERSAADWLKSNVRMTDAGYTMK